MKRFIFLGLVTTFTILMHCGAANADTIILKSGREIQCSKIKQESDVVTCFVDGFGVGYPKEDVARIVMDHHSDQQPQKTGFTFDIWYSGMSIGESMNTARSNDIPLHRKGLVSINKHFNLKISEDYMATATEFYYRDTLMGKPATVTLFFTPTSKLLEKITISLHSADINRKSPYVREIKTMLSAKYGNPSPCDIGNMLSDSFLWKADNKFEVVMTIWTAQLNIVYSDIRLQLISQREKESINAREREEYHLKDVDKF